MTAKVIFLWDLKSFKFVKINSHTFLCTSSSNKTSYQINEFQDACMLNSMLHDFLGGIFYGVLLITCKHNPKDQIKQIEWKKPHIYWYHFFLTEMDNKILIYYKDFKPLVTNKKLISQIVQKAFQSNLLLLESTNLL